MSSTLNFIKPKWCIFTVTLNTHKSCVTNLKQFLASDFCCVTVEIIITNIRNLFISFYLENTCLTLNQNNSWSFWTLTLAEHRNTFRRVALILLSWTSL